MEQSPLVELDAVKMIYHEPHAETLAIDSLSFQVAEGEFVGVVGPSGCGKSTMLSLLCGLIRPSEGRVMIGGKPVTGVSSGVGYMLQRDYLLDWRTIEENCLLGLEVKGLLTDETRARVQALLSTYGLTEFRQHYPRQLSGGMRQKVALIRTLAFDPVLLLLDEPFSALDYQTRLRAADEIHGIIKREGKTAILVTHDIAEAISMCDRILVFTERPATLKRELFVRLGEQESPLMRRNAPGFRQLFDTIWKELDTYDKA
ncbi:MAG: ABC transporter ATP-binding protein [Eubacteriales bacterium]|nr:ABC transporter ATP-binding protein [Eubacteriales bacterium]